MGACRLASLAAALLPGTFALRSRGALLGDEAGARPGEPTRQELENLQDLQYFGEVAIGGQTVKGILDTGSFEIVAFSQRCSTCGTAGKYNEQSSSSFAKGTLRQEEHAYGSGSCWANDGYDTVSAAGFAAQKQALWVATSCDMPLLGTAKFQAIVGLGPPGEPVDTATQNLLDLKEDAKSIKNGDVRAQSDMARQLESAETELRVARSKPAMLENFGVSAFSQCLGKAPGSPGWLVWNDAKRADRPGVQKLRVAGNITWGVTVTGLKLGSRSDGKSIACASGCVGIVDTGTSLFAVPTKLYNQIFKKVSKYVDAHFPPNREPDCSSLKGFPDLYMTVAGQKLHFPPSSYIGSYVGKMSREQSQFVRVDRLSSGCQLLFMDTGEEQTTSMGPMVILGMPFFREYYTTFSLGAGPGSRTIYVSKAQEGCKPGTEAVSASDERSEHDLRPRQVDASQLRVPRWGDRSHGRF